jgi:predicted RNA-binding Zn-ribbon protein involved in translation (DUF1610 family)
MSSGRFSPPSEASQGLHVCPECGSQKVQPTDWWERGASWHLKLRCPECEWRGEGTYSQREVDRFDRELDNGCEALLGDLRRLTRANMNEEADRFASALSSDSILPEDF